MNKFSRFIFATMLVVCGTLWAFAGQDEQNGNPYFTQAELPNMVNFLPPPPEFESARFAADETQYLWGIRQRQDEERAAMAIRDAVYGMQTIIQEFCPILGLEITKDDTPELYTLLQDVGATCDSISNRAKEEYMRTRPFVYYNQQTLVPEQEESHINNGSYPSGHTVLGWTMALLLSDINPAVADQLLARGYEYGQSRVIAGYHWQSDVDAGRLGGSVLYAKLQGNERFRDQLAKAQQEFREKTQSSSHVKEVVAPVGDSRAYTITGVRATSDTRGVIIQNGVKTLRP
jgi:acid phosphatase (class A)